MHPRVENRDGGTNDLRGGGPVRSKSIKHVVLSFLTKHIISRFKVLCYQINSVLCEFLLVLIPLLDLGLLVNVQSPKTCVTKDWTKVNFESSYKIFVIESHDLFDKVLDEHTYHPYLLVSD